MKNTSMLLCIGLLTLTGSLVAQDAKAGPQEAITKGSNIIRQADAPPPGVSVLYSNLGSKTDTYYDSEGWTIAGPESELGFSQNIAEPYTPTANSTIKGLQVAAQWAGGGTDNVAVALLADSNGAPGSVIKVWNVSNLPTFGTCCGLVTVVDKAGIPVTAGTQYWIAVGTDKASVTAFDVWDYTYNLSSGTFAYEGTNTSNVWEVTSGTQSAFAVYGTTP